MTNAEIWMISLTAVIAVGGIIGACIFNNQLSVMQGQLDEMKTASRITQTAADAANKAAEAAIVGNDLSRRALIADQRPWISVTIEPAGPITWNDGGFQFSYKITLKNIGKSPAIRVTHVEAVILDRDANLMTQQIGLSELAKVKSFETANIMPGDDRKTIIHQQVAQEIVGKAAVPWAAAGGPNLITPVLIGIVNYHTQFDAETRHTGFVYEIGFWDSKKGITVTALDPVSDGVIPAELMRIRHHPSADGQID